MLNIWDRADDSFTGQICDLIYSSIHERYDPTKVFVFRSKTACPYPNYELLRLEFMPHVIKTPPDKDDITLSARAVSYVLYAEKIEQVTFALIPLQKGSAAVYTLNEF